MKLKIPFIIQAVIALPFGLAFIVIPAILMDLYVDGPMSPGYIYLTQLYGSKALGLGLMALLAITFSEIKARRAVAWSLLLFNVTHSALFIYGTSAGHLNSLGYMQAAITGGLSVLLLIGLQKEK